MFRLINCAIYKSVLRLKNDKLDHLLLEVLLLSENKTGASEKRFLGMHSKWCLIYFSLMSRDIDVDNIDVDKCVTYIEYKM